MEIDRVMLGVIVLSMLYLLTFGRAYGQEERRESAEGVEKVEIIGQTP